MPSVVEPSNGPGCPPVERLGGADLEHCLALDGLALGELWTRSQWEQELGDPRRPVLGIRRQGVLAALACGWLVLDELHITAVAVHPDQRRQGLGRQVLTALLDAASCEGCRHATLEVAADNPAALALYRSAGFQSAGVRRRYYRNGSDALIQWAQLAQARNEQGGDA